MIRASIVDIRTDTPRKSDRIFVDTNVWKSFTYAPSSLNPHAATTDYAAYVGRCASVNAALFWSPLSLSELASIIERDEWTAYNALNKTSYGVKRFREDTAARAKTVAEVKAAWGQVAALGKCAEFHLSDAATGRALVDFENLPLDGYDVYYVQTMEALGIQYIVTDDMDFASVANITVLTANQRMIRAANLFKKLLVR